MLVVFSIRWFWFLSLVKKILTFQLPESIAFLFSQLRKLCVALPLAKNITVEAEY